MDEITIRNCRQVDVNEVAELEKKSLARGNKGTDRKISVKIKYILKRFFSSI